MNWGIMATGTIARKFAGTVNAMEGQTLTACASRNKEKAESFAQEFQIKNAYGSYEEMLQEPEVEIVYIATPNHLHYENCKMCLEMGKHVLCEKPFTVRAGEAEELFALAKKKGLFIMEAFWIRHLPALKKLQEVLKAGEIGEVVYARSAFGFASEGKRRERKLDSSMAGGALLDVGIYNLGFMRMVMGDEPVVSFTSNVHINEYGTDDFNAELLTYPGNKCASVASAIGTVLPRTADIFGTRGRIYLEDYQQAESFTVYLDGKEPYTVKLPFAVNGFEYQIEECERCVKLGMNTSDVLKKEDTLEVLRQMDNIRASWGLTFACEK